MGFFIIFPSFFWRAKETRNFTEASRNFDCWAYIELIFDFSFFFKLLFLNSHPRLNNCHDFKNLLTSNFSCKLRLSSWHLISLFDYKTFTMNIVGVHFLEADGISCERFDSWPYWKLWGERKIELELEKKVLFYDNSTQIFLEKERNLNLLNKILRTKRFTKLKRTQAT